MSQYDFQLVYYQNITPLHIGCGQDVGLVDNPIIREKTTSFPFIPGSSIRGVLRDQCETKDTSTDKEKFYALLGPDAEGDVDYSGCIAVFDAKILFFPIRTDKNLFHWITCPYVIERFNRDVQHFKLKGEQFPRYDELCLKLNEQAKFYASSHCRSGNDLFLEEFPFKKISEPITDDTKNPKEVFDYWITKNDFGVDNTKVLIIHNHDFDYFVRNATMVMQHNRLTSAKTVDAGALFSVESVPPEAFFYGIIGGTQDRKNEGRTFNSGAKALDEFFGLIKNSADAEEAIINLGGDESTGLGVTKINWKK